MSEFPMHSFSTSTEFEEFLEREHSTAPGIYLKMAKKASGIASISAAEAVETALCFGWIDGRANIIDDEWWCVRYTPRRAKSIWSKKNVNTIARLTEEDRMRPACLVAVEGAKGDGRWDRAYAGPATIQVPDDFAAALAHGPIASAFFESMNKSDRYAVLWRVETASTLNRAKKIETLVKMLAAGKRPGAPAQKAEKTKTDGVTKAGKKALISGHRARSQNRNPTLP
ncbi:hypothetical protein EJ08DRAFT_672823 [Tothia fuscella]|uniref:Bacteriocin-protection protein n=1 Tax=Tothia fuscella TaxID=1048955 RepID=A0A9P4TUJ1_9PEZI|nr:hypothetical protein EJ08DRAFT_672823 [Tothia fuscella]